MKLNTVTFADSGFLQELYKDAERGQVSMRVIPPDTGSGGSLHLRKDEKWWVAMGTALVLLELSDGKKRTFVIKGPAPYIVEVPAGTGHEIVNKGIDDVVLFWHSSEVYDPDDPDRHEWSFYED